MSRATLAAAATYFFKNILPGATQKHFSDLANAEVLLGAYRRYSGAALAALGQSLTPEFILKVTSGAVSVQSDAPAFGDAPVAVDAPSQPLIWMRYAADPKVDDQATIQDLMGDLDTYAARKFNVAGVDIQIPDDAATPANSQQWAQALQTNRAAVPDNLTTLTEVPAAFKTVAPTLDAFKLILSHFFTYDSNGAYYPRWSGGGRQIPQDLSTVYKQNNVRELKLARDQMYVYLLAPKALFTTKNAEAHDYCEAVLRFEDTGDTANPYSPTLIQSVYKRLPDGTAPFHDFVFFEAEDGVGLNVPLAARVKMSSPLTTFLLSVPDKAEDRASFFHDSTHVLDGAPPLVSLLATTTSGDLTMPAGVLAGQPDARGLLKLQAPVETIPAVAALAGVLKLDLTGYTSQLSLNLVRTAIGFDAFRSKFSAGKQDGVGVIVGIIDSGIDGTHPAFKDASGNSRILAFWDQTDGPVGNANSPAAHNPGNAAYNLLRFGRERLGADCINAVDFGEGHGTHVSGIAAGSEVTNAAGNVPHGIASGANLIVVSAIGRKVSDPVLAAQYIFQKAADLHMPCAINMSFESHLHAHDGTDDLSTSLTGLVFDGTKYFPGRVLVAAAGNKRRDPIHFRRTIATGASTVVNFAMNGLEDPADPKHRDLVTFWVRPTTLGATPNLRIALQHVASGWSSSAVTPSSAPLGLGIPALKLNIFTSPFALDAHNGDYNVIFDFQSAPPASPMPAIQWRFLITNPGPPVEINAWDGMKGGFPGLLASDNEMKIGTPACAFDVISVACSCSRLSWPDIDTPATSRNFGETRLGDIGSFSSPGPIRTCSKRMFSLFGVNLDFTHQAIDITAPGSATQSALASVVPITAATPAGLANRVNVAKNSISWMMQGTSMASPVVTGLVACMLAEEPSLTQDDVRKRILAAGNLPAAAATIFKPGAPDPNDWGPGLVNAPALKP